MLRSILYMFLCTWLSGIDYAQANVKRIAIIAALPLELEEIGKNLQNVTSQIRSGDTFRSGTLAGVETVLTLSGVGKVNAAITAQRLISEFNVKAIIFCGVAGGISKNTEIGDIVMAKSAYYHDVGYYGEKFILQPVGVFPQFGMGKGDEDIQIKPIWPTITDKKIDFLDFVFAAFLKVESKLKQVTINDKLRQPRVSSGIVATGDQFIANEKKKLEIRDQVPGQGAHVVEMEGAAVAHVAARNKIPFLLLRAVSDKASEEAFINFHTFFPVVAANNALLIQTLFNDKNFYHYQKSL